MNDDEAALFMMTLAALQAAETADSGSASKGFIESAEPMAATCTVETSEEVSAESVGSKTDAKVERSDSKA